MKKMLIVSLIVSALMAEEKTFEYKNETLRLRISKDSVNRIVLPAEITGKIFSQEKNLNVQLNNNEAYVKVIPIKKTEFTDNKAAEAEIIYADNEAEVFFITDKKTYSVVFVPDKIESRTVYIADSSLAKEDAVKIEKGSSEYIKNIKNIFKLAIANELKNSFTEVSKNIQNDDFLYLSQFNGSNFLVNKYFLKTESDETIDKINAITKNKIVATALFEQNYFVLCKEQK
ncbi:MAG: type-F conjugative transfer system secretin TraK [Sulfurimonas sp.]|jgi:hypothetical protein